MGAGTYAGQSPEARRDDRRRRLVAAALEIWGDDGWAAVTMRRVCAHAQLIDRYFYESFADRDALLVAVWDQIHADAVERIARAIAAARERDRSAVAQLRAAITAIVLGIAADPRRARIAFGEHAGSALLEQRRHATLQKFADLIIAIGRPYLRPGADDTALRMSTVLGVGGFTELISAWQAGLIRATPAQVIEHATMAAAQLAAGYLRANKPTNPMMRLARRLTRRARGRSSRAGKRAAPRRPPRAARPARSRAPGARGSRRA